MKIINVKKRKHNSNCIITFDNEATIELSMDLVLKYNLAKNRIIDELELDEISFQQHEIDLKQTAYNYAAYKPRTVFQIKSKLKEKKYSEIQISKAIEFLEIFGLLDDRKFAYNFAKDYAKRTKSGNSRIIIELRQRGIDKPLAEEAAAAATDSVDLNETAYILASKKYKLIMHKPKENIFRALRDLLLRKGYDFDIVKQVIDKIFSEND